jgi:hypothetical protein
MTIFQRQLLSELGAGPDGEPISESKLVYLQERLRGRFFDFLIGRFEAARSDGLNQKKLARRIRKSPEVVNRWLSTPSNLTLDSISDLFAGIGAEELNFSSSSLLGRMPVNYWHLDDAPLIEDALKKTPQREQRATAAEKAMIQPQQDQGVASMESAGS